MSKAGRWLAGAAAAAGYLWAVRRRNVALEPPPVRDLEGGPLPERGFALRDGARISLLDVGEGRPLLLVPGADGVKETWRYQIPALARRRRVIAPDLRSEVPAGADFDLFRGDLLELLDALEVDSVALAGQSLGGAVAMRFAARHPDRVRALVLCNTLARVSYEHVGLNRAALAPVAMATTRYLPTPLARLAARGWSRKAAWIFDDSPGSENVVDYALWTGPRTVSPRVSSRRVDLLRGEDLRTELDEIRAPTLVVKGPRDAYCPPSWSKEIAAGVEGASYVEVPGTGHCSHISAPGKFNRLVGDWLEAVDPPGEGAPGDAGDGGRETSPRAPAAAAPGPDAGDETERDEEDEA